jgi:hypothetical protein
MRQRVARKIRCRKSLRAALIDDIIANDLQHVKRMLNSGKFAKAASASLLMTLILLLSLFSASPDLHKWLHSDAGEPGHHCVVTEFIHGKVDVAIVASVTIGFVALFGAITLLGETFVLPLADYRFSASRAPPV